VPEIARAEGEGEREQRGDGGERTGMTLHRRPLQRASVIERAALRDRLLDELLDQARRMRG
jgi:hypothetical protein